MPVRISNYFLKANARIICALLLLATQNLYAQTIPTAPNQRNTDGKRIGEWIITYTKSWKETSIADSIAFYRKIAFDKMGKPQGKTHDYYLSDALQFEGMILQIEPEEITDGLCVWYYENGQKSKESTFINGKEEGLVKTWYEDGKPEYRYEKKNGQIEGIVTNWDEKGDSTKLYFENGERLDLSTLNENLAKLYQQGKYLESSTIAEKYVKIAQLTLGENNLDYVTRLNNLAVLYDNHGQYNKAEPLYIKVLAIRKKALGEDHPYYSSSLNNLAGLYDSQGQYAKAESLYLQALAIRKKVLGEKHPSYASILNNLAVLYDNQGKYNKAESLYVKALAIRKKVLGEEHPDYANSLNNLAGLYSNQGLYSKAESLYLEVLAIYKKALGKEHPDYANSLNNLAKLYSNQGLYSKAEPLYIQALVIRKKVLGEEHPDYANSLNNLAGLYSNQGLYSKAEPLYIQALVIRKKVLGEEHPDYANSLSNLAGLYYSQGQYDKTEPYFLKVLAIRKKTLGEEHPDYATSLNNLGFLYKEQGQYAKAEPLYVQALAINKKSLGEEHPDYATSLENLASLYRSKGEYTKAEPLYAEALAINKKSLGEKHPDYATSLSYLGSLYKSLGQYTKAESLYIQALSIQKEVLGEEHPDYAISLNNLAGLYDNPSQYIKAEPLYIQALAIRKKVLGEVHPDYALSLNNLAYLYASQGQYIKAEPLFIQALTIFKKTLGEEHPSYASILNNLVNLYASQGQYSKAEPLYIQVLAIRKKALGEEHPDYANSLNDLAILLYVSQGQYTKAEPFFSQSIQIEKTNLLTFLETANQAQQEAYIRKNEDIFKSSHSFGLLAKTPASITAAYESALLMKGIQLQNTSQLLNYIRQSKDTLLLAQHEQWLALKRSINTQNNLPIAKRVGVEVMQEQADSLYKIMARQSVAFRNFKAAFQITPQAIQQKLKTQEAAIEFVHFQYYNGKRWTDSIYYAALVLRKDWAAPRMVYLCEKRALDSLLNLREKEERNNQYVERIYGYNSRGIELDKGKPLRSLYTLLWQPIDSLLSGVSTIYYSPSGLLNQINMAAIATPTPRQRLLDKYDQLIQLRSTREIVMPQEPVNYTQQALLMGSIEYNLDSLTYRRVNASYTQNRGGNSLSLPNSRGGIYDPLPATDEEISNSQTIMHTQKWKADTLKGLRASEEAFQYYASLKPRVIHLATHGFFLEDTLTRRKRDKELRFDKEPTLLTSGDPMQRSGLVLAGGNHAWQGKTPIANQADGLLTASEIGAMVLNNTELAVLSACETGLGDVKGAEGVFGLQRAFKMAGVKYLLMSLWKVNDEITSRFMQKFYENWLTKKMSVREAYQHTLKQFRQDHPNPYDWAAFVLLE